MAKRDAVKNNYYEPFMNGGRTTIYNNSAENRMRLHEMMYTRTLTELVLHRFKWTNLPETVDKRFLELGLVNQGNILFYRHPDNDRFLVSRMAHGGYINHYDNPTEFTPIANRLSVPKMGPQECVPIWNNYLRTPDFDVIAVYAYKLASIDIDIEIAADNLRQTNVVAVPEGQQQTWVNIIRQRKMGEPLIFGNAELNTDAFMQLDVGGNPDSLDKLLIARTKVMNDCMTMLGIDNSNMDKKERLVTDEVNANSEQVDSMLNIALTSRREAVEQINALFGLDVSVDPATGGESDGMEPEDREAGYAEDMEEGGDGGDFYNDDK